MIKNSCLVIALFCFSILSCNDAGTDTATIAEDSITVYELADSSLTLADLGDSLNFESHKMVPPPSKKVKVKIDSMAGYGSAEAFARMTADTLELILNSNGFKRAVVNTSFPNFNRKMNGQQIYDTIMRAHEEDGPGGDDYVINLRLRTITLEEDGERWINNCNRSTIGIDGSGSGIAAVCTNFLQEAATKKRYSWLAAHFIHEYMHILDFSHPYYKSKSVPYKIQQIVETLIEQPSLRN